MATVGGHDRLGDVTDIQVEFRSAYLQQRNYFSLFHLGESDAVAANEAG